MISSVKNIISQTLKKELTLSSGTDFLDLHGKLYMKQAWAAMIHSARVSQKMAMLLCGRWPSDARPLPSWDAAVSVSS